jgi:aspartyl-tRNA(Asn)/glutamyl-tRNA(Gln) amidotransferase subunit B
LQDLGGGELEAVVERVVLANPKAVSEFKAGNPKSLNFLLGLLMRETKGKADARELQKRLEKRIQ